MERARRRRGMSLIEVLMVSVILSGALMVVFYQLRATARTSSFSRQHLIAWQLLANMCERYRLMPAIKLSEMFLGGGGQHFIDADPILNSDSVMSSDQVHKLGFTRDGYYYYPPGGLGAGILHLVVTWKGMDGRVHSVTQELVQGAPARVIPAMAAPDRPESQTSSGAEVSAPPPDSSMGTPDVEGEHALIRRLREIDRKDGHEDVDWPQVPADAPLTTAIDAAVRALRRQSIPDGIYPLEWEDFSVDLTQGPGPLGERGKLSVLWIRCPSGSLYLLLREEYRPSSPGEGLMRLLNGDPVASRGEHAVEKNVTTAPGLGAPIGSAAHVDLTPTRLLIYRQQADADGREVPFRQSLELVTLDPQLAGALLSRQSESGARASASRVDALIGNRGLGVPVLPHDPESRQRLGW